MANVLSLEDLRALPRHRQVFVLENAVSIGIGITKHYVAHYYRYADYYAALCSTRCGIDFSLIFREGSNAYFDMLELMTLKNLPKPVRGLSVKQSREARIQEFLEEYNSRPKETVQQIMDRLANSGVLERYEVARLRGEQMEFFRSLEAPAQIFLMGGAGSMGGGGTAHYHAHFTSMDDFFIALATTTDGVDFQVAFREGRIHADMLRAVAADRDKERGAE